MPYIKYSNFNTDKLVLEAISFRRSSMIAYNIKYNYGTEENPIVAHLKVLAPEVFTRRGVINTPHGDAIYAEFDLENKETKEFITGFCEEFYNSLLSFIKMELGEAYTLKHPLGFVKDKDGEITRASKYFSVFGLRDNWYTSNGEIVGKDNLINRKIRFEPFISFPSFAFVDKKGIVKTYIDSSLVNSIKPAASIFSIPTEI
jgi:hypothetical protein